MGSTGIWLFNPSARQPESTIALYEGWVATRSYAGAGVDLELQPMVREARAKSERPGGAP